MSQVAIEDYRELFKNETMEQLEKLVAILIDVRNLATYEEKPVHELFRLAHNIKGASGMMELETLKNAMHALETVLGNVREKKTCLNPDEIDKIIQFSQSVAEYIAGDNWEADQELKSWQKNLADFQQTSSPATENGEKPLVLSEAENIEITAWQEAGKTVYGIQATYVPDSMMKGASAFVLAKFMEKFGKIVKTVPAVEKLATENFSVFKMIIFTEEEIDESVVTSFSGQDQQSLTIRKWVCRTSGEKRPAGVDQQSSKDTVRVSFSKVDRLLRDIEEVSRVNSALLNIYNRGDKGMIAWHDIGGLIWQQEKLIRELHADSLRLGMVSVNQLFNRFSLIVHDVAKKCGKQVEIKFSGEETEIEKRVCERLIDPLTHLVRNAVDHGLEDNESRLRIGKTGTGTITMNARQEGEFIVISVSDDGRGLDPEKIREKAISKNLIAENDRLSEAEILKVVFLPGFSTADRINDISGRGVGLDVVQNSIHELKGNIGVESSINRGTTFSLRIPFSQAIVNLFFVQVDDRIFGVPLENVIESTLIENGSILKTSQGLFCSWQDEDIPLIDLGEFFEIKSAAEQTKMPLLVLREGQRTVGVIANDFIGQEKVMLKPLNPLLDHPLITGIATLSNGEAALLVDIQKMLDWETVIGLKESREHICGSLN